MGCSVDDLPVELLADIFLEYQIPRPRKDKSPFEDVVECCQKPVTNWLTLMLVCRRFHDIVQEKGALRLSKVCVGSLSHGLFYNDVLFRE